MLRKWNEVEIWRVIVSTDNWICNKKFQNFGKGKNSSEVLSCERWRLDGKNASLDEELLSSDGKNANVTEEIGRLELKSKNHEKQFRFQMQV